jgi:hypothetical protein
MNCWRSFVFAILASALLAGCVYVPSYFEDPVTPPPWDYPLEPYPRRYDYYYGHGPAPNFPRRRYFEERTHENYRPDVTPSDRQYSNENPKQVVPPSKEELPVSPKGTEPRTGSNEVPVATKGSKPGRVKIPFPPYSELDVTGLTPGSLAKDPTSGKIFRLP